MGKAGAGDGAGGRMRVESTREPYLLATYCTVRPVGGAGGAVSGVGNVTIPQHGS